MTHQQRGRAALRMRFVSLSAMNMCRYAAGRPKEQEGDAGGSVFPCDGEVAWWETPEFGSFHPWPNDITNTVSGATRKRVAKGKMSHLSRRRQVRFRLAWAVFTGGYNHVR